MKSETFDYIWKISLIILLIISIGYMFWEFKQVDKEAMTCKSNPFIYGAIKLGEIYNASISCFCPIGFDKGFEFNKTSYQVINNNPYG